MATKQVVNKGNSTIRDRRKKLKIAILIFIFALSLHVLGHLGVVLNSLASQDLYESIDFNTFFSKAWKGFLIKGFQVQYLPSVLEIIPIILSILLLGLCFSGKKILNKKIPAIILSVLLCFVELPYFILGVGFTYQMFQDFWIFASEGKHYIDGDRLSENGLSFCSYVFFVLSQVYCYLYLLSVSKSERSTPI